MNSGDLGRRVAERRRELGLSLEELATRAGMSSTYLGALESSPSPQLSRGSLWRLANALETTVDLISGGGMTMPPGQGKPAERPALDSLDVNECQSLIAPGGIGRIVYSQPRGPVAIPVNFQMMDGDIIFLTASITADPLELVEGNVSFEVDHVDETLGEGWSVLLSGHAQVLRDPDEIERAASSGVEPWAGGKRDVYVRIVPEQITGRRIRRT